MYLINRRRCASGPVLVALLVQVALSVLLPLPHPKVPTRKPPPESPGSASRTRTKCAMTTPINLSEEWCFLKLILLRQSEAKKLDFRRFSLVFPLDKLVFVLFPVLAKNGWLVGHDSESHFIFLFELFR